MPKVKEIEVHDEKKIRFIIKQTIYYSENEQVGGRKQTTANNCFNNIKDLLSWKLVITPFVDLSFEGNGRNVLLIPALIGWNLDGKDAINNDKDKFRLSELQMFRL